VIPPEVSSAEV